EDLDVVPARLRPPTQHIVDDEHGLGVVRRAGRVGDDSPGRAGVEGGGEQFALQSGQCGDVGGLTAIAGLGTSAQGAESGAGRVDEHPRIGAAGIATVTYGCGDVVQSPGGVADEFDPVFARVEGLEGLAPLRGCGTEDSGLAAGAGAQVAPGAGGGVDFG